MTTMPTPEGEDPEAWQLAGFSPRQAVSFKEWRISLDVAVRWRKVGVTDGLDATRWGIADVTPEQVPGWTRAGIDLDAAFKWRRAGVGLEDAKRRIANGENPEGAQASGPTIGAARVVTVGAQIGMFGGGPAHEIFQKAQAAGIDMQVLQTYMIRQWLDEEAIEWASYGIDAGDAYQWIELGLAAEEAGHIVADGATIVEVLREWWVTGIAFDEIAEWIGAGLSADEAAAQRCRGVTTQQAAALARAPAQ